jgi:hypothetical protein
MTLDSLWTWLLDSVAMWILGLVGSVIITWTGWLVRDGWQRRNLSDLETCEAADPKQAMTESDESGKAHAS